MSTYWYTFDDFSVLFLFLKFSIIPLILGPSKVDVLKSSRFPGGSNVVISSWFYGIRGNPMVKKLMNKILNLLIIRYSYIIYIYIFTLISYDYLRWVILEAFRLQPTIKHAHFGFKLGSDQMRKRFHPFKQFIFRAWWFLKKRSS